MKIAKYTLPLWCLLAVNACTSVTVVPQMGDMFTVIANAETEAQATKNATVKASRICFLENQSVKIIDSETIYQASDSNQKALIKLAKDIIPGSKTSGPYTPAEYTYKSTLSFKCI